MSFESILVVAATPRELAVPAGWRTFVCGIGPIEAAAATAAEISRARPAAILQVGIAGARRALGLAHASLVIGTEARYVDFSASFDLAPTTIVPPQFLLDAVSRALPEARTLPIGTSARVGGTIDVQSGAASQCAVEAMEGFAVLRAAALAGVPAIEVRAISNEIEADRAQWQLGRAFDAITSVTPKLVDAVARAMAATHA